VPAIPFPQVDDFSQINLRLESKCSVIAFPLSILLNFYVN